MSDDVKRPARPSSRKLEDMDAEDAAAKAQARATSMRILMKGKSQSNRSQPVGSAMSQTCTGVAASRNST
eukprot:CAMPEP_0117067798 /NCGR_PEP_ID=MMETSP0472-20121206/47476_1 /TAXON_ID=693140 ORGANISM="Tiarina fusus, Strain LIS" /NCGR_SAMPLE_ID=MMETSP0472 /ASSEMBLY_ACC=CAM_ASM_000603 /LENGTH=69 /DNA_ID=CAMNT_0004789523 /DNA_START=91 /DNA_END=296 /DNA_ORIENTATION=-